MLRRFVRLNFIGFSCSSWPISIDIGGGQQIDSFFYGKQNPSPTDIPAISRIKVIWTIFPALSLSEWHISVSPDCPDLPVGWEPCIWHSPSGYLLNYHICHMFDRCEKSCELQACSYNNHSPSSAIVYIIIFDFIKTNHQVFQGWYRNANKASACTYQAICVVWWDVIQYQMYFSLFENGAIFV